MESLRHAASGCITSESMSGNSFNMDTRDDVDGDEFMLSTSAPNCGEPSRSSRLARKAESARQARLRHKQYVTELQDQVHGLQSRLNKLETQLSSQQPTAAQAFHELLGALSAEQKAQLNQWLVSAQGENHILKRVTAAGVVQHAGQRTVASHAHLGLSSPMGINGLSNQRTHSQTLSTPIAINGSAHRTSPMESDEDTFVMSRSWDDSEAQAARSILNLNSPNGFHPSSTSSVSIPSNFALPAAQVAASAPSSFSTHFTSFTPRGMAAQQ